MTTTTITSPATSDTLRWLRPYPAVVVAGLTLVAAVTPFGEDMPAFHRVAAPVAAVVMLATWATELAGLGWPRLVLILGVVLPEVWLTLIGHVSANNLFLFLMLARVGVAGTRAERLLAFAWRSRPWRWASARMRWTARLPGPPGPSSSASAIGWPCRLAMPQVRRA